MAWLNADCQAIANLKQDSPSECTEMHVWYRLVEEGKTDLDYSDALLTILPLR